MLDTLREVFGAEWGVLVRDHPGEAPPEVVARSGTRDRRGAPEVSRTLLAQVAGANAGVIRPEITRAPALEAAASIPSEVHSVIAGALRHEDRGEGVVYLENPAAVRGFGAPEEQLLRELLAFAGELLARARTSRELAEDRERLNGEVCRILQKATYSSEELITEIRSLIAQSSNYSI